MALCEGKTTGLPVLPGINGSSGCQLLTPECLKPASYETIPSQHRRIFQQKGFQRGLTSLSFQKGSLEGGWIILLDLDGRRKSEEALLSVWDFCLCVKLKNSFCFGISPDHVVSWPI